MTAHLPPNLLALFAPRSPLRYIPLPQKKARPLPIYTGIAEFTQFFDDPKTVDYSDYLPLETVLTRRKRIAQEKKKEHDAKIAEALSEWDPKLPAPNKTGDPYRTLFVGRLAYETTEETLRKEFEYYGPIVKLTIVRDSQTGKSRGYAFIEFERERDMKSAYKQADGKRIDGHRVLVDMERGRTILNWRPRRLGGGLGGRTLPRPKVVTPSPSVRRDSYPPRERTDSYRPPGRGGDRRGQGPPRGPPGRDSYPGPGPDYHGRGNNRPDNYRRDPRDSRDVGRDQRDGRDYRDGGRDQRDSRRDDRGNDRSRDEPRRDYRGHPAPRGDRHFERDSYRGSRY